MQSYYGIDNHRKYKINRMGRDFFLGDLHGSIQLLKKVLHKVKFNFETDRVFCVGDIIDRGDASGECLMLCKSNWFYSVLGNHESMLLESKYNDFKREIWFKNGGLWWGEVNYGKRILLEDIIINEFCISLSVDTILGNIGVIHSGYPFSEWPLKDSDELNKSQIKNILWDRDILKERKDKFTTGVSFIISGHTPIEFPTLLGNHLYIDTGCSHYANENLQRPRLTLCEVKSATSFRFHEVDSKNYMVTELLI